MPKTFEDCPSLTEIVLKPNSIEKVNVELALAVFHESTVIGLKEYGFYETASAVDLFLKLLRRSRNVFEK